MLTSHTYSKVKQNTFILTQESKLMFQVATYSTDFIFEKISAARSSKILLPDGNKFRNSIRIQLFVEKGTECVTCGINGTVFILETQDLKLPPHLNLYAVNENGEYILMTKDHIHPKSKGGLDEMENFNPMCSPCNGKKADKI